MGPASIFPQWVILTLLFLFFYFVFAIAIRFSNIVVEVKSHWQHYYDDFSYAPSEFYNAIETAVNKQELPGVKISKITYGEGGVFSPRREYLRIARGKTVFDICAAPYAKGFFISSWQGELPSYERVFVRIIPFIGKYLERSMQKKTYYQIDTEQMLFSVLHKTILGAIDSVTEGKGFRTLTDDERQMQQIKNLQLA